MERAKWIGLGHLILDDEVCGHCGSVKGLCAISGFDPHEYAPEFDMNSPGREEHDPEVIALWKAIGSSYG